VAMKHVRDPVPNVQLFRREVSSALAAVVERATTKERDNRYPDVREMLHDLEEALAIEVARAGEVSGEATSVLQTLSGDTAEFAPQRLRHPRRALITTLLVGALAAVLVVVLAGRTERGTTGSAKPAPGAPGLRDVRVVDSTHFDPPPGGDGEEHSKDTPNVRDGNPSTYWDTEEYRGGNLGVKPGVGLYVKASSPVAARQLNLTTRFRGWDAEVYAAEDLPSTLQGWGRPVSPMKTVRNTDTFKLDTGGRKARYYLIWITALPESGRASISELTLRR